LCLSLEIYRRHFGDPKWRTAMQEERKALHKNKTWDLVKLPNEKKVVGCQWVFTIKHKADGSVERYKARLVAVLHKPIGLIMRKHLLQ
jgi:predicted metal-dependent hydrolase